VVTQTELLVVVVDDVLVLVEVGVVVGTSLVVVVRVDEVEEVEELDVVVVVVGTSLVVVVSVEVEEVEELDVVVEVVGGTEVLDTGGSYPHGCRLWSSSATNRFRRERPPHVSFGAPLQGMLHSLASAANVPLPMTTPQ
jgi:hypothetical protein